MKSNLFRKATALGVATAMALSTSAFAMSDVSTLTTTQKSEGTGAVLAPTYKIKVPTSLSFSIDPFELGALATGSAINPRSAIKVPGYGYAVSNQSNIAVSVAVEATLVPGANVFTVPLADINSKFTSAASLTSNGATANVAIVDQTNKEKEISMYMLIASTGALVTAAGATLAQPTVGTIYPTSASAIEMNVAPAVGSADKPARATFLLDKGIVNPTTGVPTGVVSTTPTSFGVFSFQGDVNSQAAWAANDVKVSVKYLFAPVSAANHTTLKTTPGYRPGMQSVVSGTALKCDNTPVQPVAPEITMADVDRAALPTSEQDLTVTVGAGYRAVSNTTGTTTSVVKIVGATTIQLAATDFVWSTDGLKLTLKPSAYTKLKTVAPGTYSFEATAKNGRTVKDEFVIS